MQQAAEYKVLNTLSLVSYLTALQALAVPDQLKCDFRDKQILLQFYYLDSEFTRYILTAKYPGP